MKREPLFESKVSDVVKRLIRDLDLKLLKKTRDGAFYREAWGPLPSSEMSLYEPWADHSIKVFISNSGNATFSYPTTRKGKVVPDINITSVSDPKREVRDGFFEGYRECAKLQAKMMIDLWMTVNDLNRGDHIGMAEDFAAYRDAAEDGDHPYEATNGNVPKDLLGVHPEDLRKAIIALANDYDEDEVDGLEVKSRLGG
jgi:hypothetical protein